MRPLMGRVDGAAQRMDLSPANATNGCVICLAARAPTRSLPPKRISTSMWCRAEKAKA